MRICLCSDVHGCVGLIGKAVSESNAEIVIFAGDLAERAGEDPGEAKKALKEFIKLCREKEGVHFVVVSGNHDRQLDERLNEVSLPNLSYLSSGHSMAVVKGVEISGQYSCTRKSRPQGRIVVFHKKPKETRMNLECSGVRLVVHGDTHREKHSTRHEHPGKAVKLDVSSAFRCGGTFGYYTIEWLADPFVAEWHEIDSPAWEMLRGGKHND